MQSLLPNGLFYLYESSVQEPPELSEMTSCCEFRLRSAYEAVNKFFQMDFVQRLIVFISVLDFIAIVYIGFDLLTCLIIQSAHLLVLLCLLIALTCKRPSLLLPNMIFKGCFASTLLFLALQGAEQGTESKLMLAWYTIAALLCIFEMHYSLAAMFSLVEKMRAAANAPPSYKEVRIEDCQLPSYEDAVRAIQNGTARIPPVPRAPTTAIRAPLYTVEDDAAKAPGAANPV